MRALSKTLEHRERSEQKSVSMVSRKESTIQHWWYCFIDGVTHLNALILLFLTSKLGMIQSAWCPSDVSCTDQAKYYMEGNLKTVDLFQNHYHYTFCYIIYLSILSTKLWAFRGRDIIQLIFLQVPSLLTISIHLLNVINIDVIL